MFHRPSRTLMCACVIVLSVVATPRPVLADPWQPLEVGRRWEYRGVGGAHQVEHITGLLSLRGRTVAVKAYDEGADAGLENYWQLGADGTVYLCGFAQPGGGLALAYEPPIAYLPGPPALGVGRTTDVTAYNLVDGSVYTAISLRFSILEEVDLVLPGGAFHALGTGEVAPAPPTIVARGRTFSLDGRSLGGMPANLGSSPSDWFTDGVGVVQYLSSDLYQLVATDLPTPTLHHTWGALKRLYE
jgi:hypothetical protein